MKSNVKWCSVTAALIGIAVLPGQGSAQGQTGWGNFQLHGSWISPASLAETDDIFVNGVFLDDGLSFGLDDGFGLGAGLDFWFGGGRIWGLSMEGTYKGWDGWSLAFDPDFELDDLDFDDEDVDFGQSVAVWQYDASLQLRLMKPEASTKWLPWLSAGIGGVSVNPDDDIALFPQPLCVSNNNGCEFDDADVFLDTGSSTSVAFVWGLGMDFFLSNSIAFRLEGKDYWTDSSPFVRLSDGVEHDGGHNWQFNGGLSFYWGGRSVAEPGFVREEPILVTPPPAPPPPPPPPPAEARLSMCVVEPQGYQLRNIEAVRVIDENRVYVMRNGTRVPVETAYPANAPIYVRGASWYMADQPLVIDLETDARVSAAERNRIELVQFGAPSQVDMNELVFVGTVNASPVYAKKADVAPFIGRLQPRLTGNADLGTILKSDTQLAQSFGAVRTYYLAVEPNCVFHPVSVTHFVRRTRG